MKHIKPIKTESDYQLALQELGAFFDNNPDQANQTEQDYYEVLAALVERYETQYHPITPPNPIDAIRFRMEQMGLEIKDMEHIIGKPNRVYEIFNGNRRLSLAMIRRINKELGISADILIKA